MVTSIVTATSASESLGSLNRVFTPEQVQKNLAEYEARYPEFFAILDQLGLGEWPYISPFSGQKDNESFQNARLQTGMVVLISERLANTLLEAWKITEDEKDSIIRSAVLHNALKHLEVLWKSELPWVKAYSEAWYDVLRSKVDGQDLGVWKSDIDIASIMRKVIGHTSLKDFVVMNNGIVTLNPKKSLAEMIVHIASDMVGAKNPKFPWYTPNIQISNFRDRAAFADFPQAYPFLWDEWFALSEGGITEIPDTAETDQTTDLFQEVSSYYEWQEKVYEMICEEIVSRLGLTWGANALLWIVHKVTQVTQARVIESFSWALNSDNPEHLRELRSRMIDLADTLLKQNPDKYVFSASEIADCVECVSFLKLHDILLDWSDLTEVSRDDRRVIFEKNVEQTWINQVDWDWIQNWFSIKRYEVLKQSRVLSKGLWDHYHTLTGSPTSQFTEAFVIQEWQWKLVTKTIPDGQETCISFQSWDIILLPKGVSHTLWFEWEMSNGAVARFTGFLPRHFDPKNMDLNPDTLTSPYEAL